MVMEEQRRLEIRKYTFSQRIINGWNKLSTDCVHARSVSMFQNRGQLSRKGELHLESNVCGFFHKSMECV